MIQVSQPLLSRSVLIVAHRDRGAVKRKLTVVVLVDEGDVILQQRRDEPDQGLVLELARDRFESRSACVRTNTRERLSVRECQCPYSGVKARPKTGERGGGGGRILCPTLPNRSPHEVPPELPRPLARLLPFQLGLRLDRQHRPRSLVRRESRRRRTPERVSEVLEREGEEVRERVAAAVFAHRDY